jgi:hypothetical protein
MVLPTCTSCTKKKLLVDQVQEPVWSSRNAQICLQRNVCCHGSKGANQEHSAAPPSSARTTHKGKPSEVGSCSC